MQMLKCVCGRLKQKKIGFKSDWISLEDLITFSHPILAQANDAFG